MIRFLMVGSMELIPINEVKRVQLKSEQNVELQQREYLIYIHTKDGEAFRSRIYNSKTATEKLKEIAESEERYLEI